MNLEIADKSYLYYFKVENPFSGWVRTIDSKLKIRFLISGGLIAFGLYNIFSYLFLFSIISLPFPFEHTVAEFITKGSTSILIGYEPLQEASQDPYWLFWSLAMYFGCGYLIFLVIRLEKTLRKRAIIKSTKIAAITTGVGFALFVVGGIAVSFVTSILPEPEPYIEVEFENFKEVYESGEPIFFNVNVKGYDYTMSFLEMRILNEEGMIVWEGEPYLPWNKNFDGPFYIGTDITRGKKPIIIFAPGKYTLEISLSGHTVTKEFQIKI